MAIKRGSLTSYSWPVKFEVPGNNGESVVVEFTAMFRHLSQSKREEIGKSLLQGEGAHRLTDAEIIDEVMCGWGDDVKGTDDNPLPFTSENRDQIFEEFAGARTATVLAWLDSVTNGAVKNLKTPPVTGPVAGNQ